MKSLIYFMIVQFALYGIDFISIKVSNSFHKLQTKEYTLSQTDHACMLINRAIEFIFSIWLCRFMYHNLPFVSPFPLISIPLLFVVDDLLYAPYHRLLHHKYLYKWIHHRHHRIAYPSEYHTHAILEHPLEMIGALVLHSIMIMTLAPILDFVSVSVHIGLKAFGASLNHSGRDVKFLMYRAKYHHMHHTYLKCNYSQYLMLYDYAFDTMRLV